MVVIHVMEVAKAHRSVLFSYEVPDTEYGPAMLRNAAYLYVSWDSRRVLSQSKMQGTPSA